MNLNDTRKLDFNCRTQYRGGANITPHLAHGHREDGGRCPVARCARLTGPVALVQHELHQFVYLPRERTGMEGE